MVRLSRIYFINKCFLPQSISIFYLSASKNILATFALWQNLLYYAINNKKIWMYKVLRIVWFTVSKKSFEWINHNCNLLFTLHLQYFYFQASKICHKFGKSSQNIFTNSCKLKITQLFFFMYIFFFKLVRTISSAINNFE